MIYVEAPEIVEAPPNTISVFIAGSITGTKNWQKELIDQLNKCEKLIVYNPRRENFPIDDPSAAKEQIIWEFNMLRAATMISFWFAEETTAPITLYELGAHSMTKKPLIIGSHPKYERLQDITIQTSLVRPQLPIHDNLEDVAGSIRFWYNMLRN